MQTTTTTRNELTIGRKVLYTSAKLSDSGDDHRSQYESGVRRAVLPNHCLANGIRTQCPGR